MGGRRGSGRSAALKTVSEESFTYPMRNPVADNQDSLTAGESDPVLMQDF